MKEIINKLRFKNPGIIYNAPKKIEEEFIQLGFKTKFDKKKTGTNTLVFINNHKEFIDFLTKNLKNIEPDSVLWFAYPKGTSKVKTDINRDIIRETGEIYNITAVTAISIDDTWSALRFRPKDKVGK